MTDQDRPTSTEHAGSARSGFPILLGYLASLPLLFLLVGLVAIEVDEALGGIVAVLSGIYGILLPIGFFVVQPNTSCVLVFFGKYRGTIREEGFFWTNPFMSKTKISLRAHNVASETIKVNDLNGNPIEIGAVVVWRVKDTAKAAFDVEDYEDYVDVQVETAVRELAKTHPYEAHRDEDGEADPQNEPVSLRDGSDEVGDELTAALQVRLERAGIEVIEARISHLAYALEIASAMLQRQQAAAIISARRLIVDGAVGMVEHALEELEKGGSVELDDERKATMVTNLLVVLCSHAEPTPVVNTGGVYN